MTRPSSLEDSHRWREFVVRYGWRAKVEDLSHLLGVDVQSIRYLRETGACSRLAKRLEFDELFSIWHGRPAEDEDWPAPRLVGRGFYEWQVPDDALLISLTGQISTDELADLLTARLRARTGDLSARRNRVAVQGRISRLGLMASDVLGGVSLPEAARQIGSLAIAQQLVAKGVVPASRVGRLFVIPHQAWQAWLATRPVVPEGYVALSSIREALGIRSDKLSEFARMGLVPSALQVKQAAAKAGSEPFGRWYVPGHVAEKLLADRRAGRTMPWHGAALEPNLKKSFALWSERRHPTSCQECARIWGRAGAPKSFDDFSNRYVPLAHGAKRHLTRPWSPGLTVQEVAAKHGCSVPRVRLAIKSGELAATRHGRHSYVTRTDATIWASRGCKVEEKSLALISMEVAAQRYSFTEKTLRAYVRDGTLKCTIGKDGAMRGVKYLLRTQLARLREKLGYSSAEAAGRIGVSQATLKSMAKGRSWRKDGRLSAEDVRELLAMKETKRGYTVPQAAKALRRTVAWVEQRVAEGAVTLTRPRWDGDEPTLTEVMMARLRPLRGRLGKREAPPKGWVLLGGAAALAGVTATTLSKWGMEGAVERREVRGRWYYKPSSVRARARAYWKTANRHRRRLPAWMIRKAPKTHDQGHAF